MSFQSTNSLRSAKKYSLQTKMPLINISNPQQHTGSITATAYKYNTNPTFAAGEGEANINNPGGFEVTRQIAGVVTFPAPVPLRISYPKNWGTEQYNHFDEFLNETYELWTDDNGNISDDVMATLKSGFNHAGAAAKKAIFNKSKAGAGAGFLEVNSTELLFQSIDFREISLGHTFAPESEADLDAALQLIHFLKLESAPERDGATRLIYPKLFEVNIQTLLQGENKPLFRTKPCALTNIEIDYTPENIWSVFKSGHPVQFRMDVSFKEVELLLKEDFPDPYNSH